MSNWCTNCITVTPTAGHGQFFQNFANLVSAAAFTLERFYSGSHVPNDRRLQWNLYNWGTKWDVDGEDGNVSVHIDPAGGSVIIYCDTAWSPPTEWAREVAVRWQVNINIEYEERNEGLIGVFMAYPDGSYEEATDSFDDEDDPYYYEHAHDREE